MSDIDEMEKIGSSAYNIGKLVNYLRELHNEI